MVMGRGGAASAGAVTFDQEIDRVTALSLCLIIYIIWQNIESLPNAELVLRAGMLLSRQLSFGSLQESAMAQPNSRCLPGSTRDWRRQPAA